MYGFRYHLITVIAIFLALTIGLLLGASLGRSGSADAPTDSMVSSLQQSFDAITQENGRLSDSLEVATSFNDDLLREWARGRLEGQDVVVLTNGQSSDAAAAVEDAVALAGGTTVGVELALPDQSDEGFASLVEDLSAAGLDVSADTTSDELVDAVAKALAQEWAQAGETARTAVQSGSPDASGADSSGDAGSSGTQTGDKGAGDSDASSAPASSDSSGASDASAAGGSGASSDAVAWDDPWDACPISRVLREHGALSVSGDFVDVVTARCVVDVALTDGVADQPDLALARALAAQGASVATGQLQGQDGSQLVGAGWDDGIAGTASLGTNEGAYGVIGLLTGLAPGEYGTEGSLGWPGATPSSSREDSSADSSSSSSSSSASEREDSATGSLDDAPSSSLPSLGDGSAVTAPSGKSNGQPTAGKGA